MQKSEIKINMKLKRGQWSSQNRDYCLPDVMVIKNVHLSFDFFLKKSILGSFLSEIKPQADGANGLRYNLTPDIIESIFKTYPAVKKKHFENVPSKLSEQEFWTKFFQSHYFHRDRIHAQGTTDIFTECAKVFSSILKLLLDQFIVLIKLLIRKTEFDKYFCTLIGTDFISRNLPFKKGGMKIHNGTF